MFHLQIFFVSEMVVVVLPQAPEDYLRYYELRVEGGRVSLS